ncbi:MAG: VWA domain-containing protein [Candidatus Kapabacteria bacterium]|nr:VWA domain-containing protein [Candidatus Kapabacteria bacterium]
MSPTPLLYTCLVRMFVPETSSPLMPMRPDKSHSRSRQVARTHQRSPMNAIIILLSLLMSVAAGMAQDISTGPMLARSSSRSEYLRGIQTDSTVLASRMRIMGVDESVPGQITASVIVLDAEGNLLPLSLDRMSMLADVACRGSAPTPYELSSAGSPRTDVTPEDVSLYVLIDNSMLSGTLTRDVILSLQRSLAGGSSADAIGLGVYNQSSTNVLSLGPLSSLTEVLRLEDVPDADGLSSLYTATQSACRILSSAPGRRALVVVTATADNATPFSTTEDVARVARDAKVPVYVIRIGLEAAGRPLRYITSSTGGRLYTLDEDQTASIGDIVSEIMFAQKWASSVTVRADVQDFAACQSPWLRLRLESPESAFAITDSIILTPIDQAIETSPSIVALFRDTTDTDLREYYQSLLAISEMLSANASMTIELTGHVSSDVGKNGDARALERANQVRSFLIANGVLSRQILVRSDGSRKPRYYFQTDGTRRLLNNRVEARMFSNGSPQHTITVEQVDNEQTAMIRLKDWRERKLNAYFEPVYDDGQTRYRIKLWGFASLDDAKLTAAEIKKYKPAYSIIE